MFVAVLFVISCSSGTPVISVEEVEGVYSPVFIGVASVFMKIRNTGRASDALLSATMDLPKSKIDLHGIEDGKMVNVSRIPVPAGKITSLGQGGTHLMVFGLPRNPEEAGELKLTLRFERTGQRVVTVRFDGKAPSAGMKPS
jgi:hypothetical protein